MTRNRLVITRRYMYTSFFLEVILSINSKALGAASAIVAGVTFLLCAAAVAIAPGSTSAFLGWVLHVDLSAMARHITLASFGGGLILFNAFVGICAALTGELYNRLAPRPLVGA